MNNIKVITSSCFAVALSFALTTDLLSAADRISLSNFNGKKTTSAKSINASKFQRVGIIRNINGGERSVIINGQKYYYGVNTKVETFNSNFSSIQSLGIGVKVGINFTVDTKDRRLLYKVYAIPSQDKLIVPNDL